MQLKGLVRFFTILLILYSIYELSFTWVVRSHENKMMAKAKTQVNFNYRGSNPPAAEKDQAVQQRYKRLLDSTKSVTVHYGPTGAISYQQAKENELNLGLDLQGGINVTLEVELGGLLRSMANNSKDPIFLQALANAEKAKANSNADYVSLFRQEYKKLNPNGRLAQLFAVAGQDRIKPNDGDDKVEGAIRTEANDAFDRTFRVLRTRIDQFGVAQPNINPDRDRGIITVELPGVQDQERVRKYLQSSANLQFWEVYNMSELQTGLMAADAAYNSAVTGGDTAAAKRQSLFMNIQPMQADNGIIGFVRVNDTALVSANLSRPEVRAALPADVKWAFGIPETKDNKTAEFVALHALKTGGREKAPIEGEGITEARSDFNQVNGQSEVTMKMNPSAARTWANMTAANTGRSIAIVLDNIVYSAPRVNGKIEGGSSSISGSFSPAEATDLANILKAGKLPAPAKIVQEQVVGPTLGAHAIKGGMMAFGLSFIVIFLLMLVYYNTSGWVANIALILNLLFTIGVLTGLGATLTAAGIAGLVLTIGMAVDTNVIIYERIKEELTKGKSYPQAVSEGYRRSLPPVLDAHVTTLLTAIILFSFGLGPVKGFATTQIIGILLSLFCGILVSRWVSDIFMRKGRHLEYFTGVSKRVFKHAAFKFIEYRKVAYAISFVVLALGVAAIFHGFDEGVEFSGGRSYQVRFDKPVNVDQVRDDLKASFGANPVIKTIGSNNQLDITTSYLITDTRPAADSIVEGKLMAGLSRHLPAGTTYEQFDKNYKLGSTTVLPTISDDLKTGAKWATFWSVLIIALYIFIRFRDWRYSMGTIVALAHDVLVTLAVFSFLREIVPFPLEIDQHFIAAILTVIGFSMNDTVIVFDRIREYTRQMVGAPKEVVINKAINDTLSRTIMTSLTVFLTILILFLVGGEVTRGFAFAMLIGVVTGTYSSIFVAAPILVDMGGKRSLGGNEPVANAEPVVSSKKELAKH
ncbi:protein translocase subunit SecD [Flaviaesturariibacter flavus]|uniref:Multifunctional fusion protein n=1 Tax=Flaviaesturariibacter flavus TaxID=2502780 RepID=A0A4R1BA34_9BACT|nr:protein translocase subunit SecD [Flaviaesturariibacter flavus]TCJ13806.1 protein translocase subunit SecD [Flaviaesturariibacter flavus]